MQVQRDAPQVRKSDCKEQSLLQGVMQNNPIPRKGWVLTAGAGPKDRINNKKQEEERGKEEGRIQKPAKKKTKKAWTALGMGGFEQPRAE